MIVTFTIMDVYVNTQNREHFQILWAPELTPPESDRLPCSTRIFQRYFLKVLAVTATANANSAAMGITIKVGCRLKGSARYVTRVITTY